MNIFLQAMGAILFVVQMAYCERTENTHLVTMTKAELMEIINCISKSQNQALCDRFAVCNNRMPEQVKQSYEKCNKEINPKGMWRCNKKEQLYESVEIPNKLFECITGSTHKLNAEESKNMVDFETCIRDLYVGGCPVPKRS